MNNRQDINQIEHEVNKILYPNSHDCGEGMIIPFEKIYVVIKALCQLVKNYNTMLNNEPEVQVSDTRDDDSKSEPR